jgi:hypothetical protein
MARYDPCRGQASGPFALPGEKMKRRTSYLPLLVALATLLGASPGATASYSATKPPSSLDPGSKTAPVQISHRHRAIVECVRVPKKASCVGRVADGDTAAVVRFERTDVTTVAFNPLRAEPRAVLPHHAGPQEQTIELPVGEWLVDWLDSQRLERLDVKPGARIQVALATTSGACQLKADHCELLPGTRERRIHVSQAP